MPVENESAMQPTGEFEAAAPKPARKPKASATGDVVRIHMNVGEQMGVAPEDVVTAVMGETGLPAKVVSNVDLRERHLFLEVHPDYANGIISKLNRTQLKGHKLKVKLA